MSSLVSLQKSEGIEAFHGQATLILINTVGLPIVRHIRVLKARRDRHRDQQGQATPEVDRRRRLMSALNFIR